MSMSVFRGYLGNRLKMLLSIMLSAVQCCKDVETLNSIKLLF